MHIFLPDGKKLEFDAPVTALDVARSIGERLASDALAVRVKGELKDVLTPLVDGDAIEILTKKQLADTAPLFRHTLGHVMSQAVVAFYTAKGHLPDSIKRGVGPAIEQGFYQDFDLPEPLHADDLPEIEKRMHDIIGQNLALTRVEVDSAEALKRFAYDPYKVELIQGLPEGESITLYAQGDYVDLCRGPHMPRTGLLPKHFKLMSVSGAYWRGSEKNPMLQRIYGIAFSTKAELDEYLFQLEEAKRRDHRKLGQELDLFVISDEIGKGLPLWLPKGAFIRHQLEHYMYDKERAHGYHHIITPHIANSKLYYLSGHLPYYKEDMYAPIEIDDEAYYLKPMNCPHHHMVFKAKPKSYRDLPVRLAEFGTVYRYERSGTLSGLARVRGFTQNDAHIYCSKTQVKDEFIRVIQLFNEVYRDFGISNFWFRLSLPDFETNPEKFGEPGPHWDESVEALRAALEETGAEYVEGIGEATFYGPKLDVQIKTVLGKEETIATNQLDFVVPGRFGLEFTNERGEKETPVVIHRAIMGSFDRFFAFYLEQTAGDFPLWLAPEQAVLVPIADRHVEYAQKVMERLTAQGFRARMDDRSERMQAKIRDAELLKIPLVLILGDQEAQNETVSIRERHRGEHKGVPLGDFISQLAQCCQARLEHFSDAAPALS